MAAVVVVMVVGSVLALGLGQAGPFQVVLRQADLLVALRRQRGCRASDGTEVNDRLRGREREAERREEDKWSRGASVLVLAKPLVLDHQNTHNTPKTQPVDGNLAAF